MSPLIAALACTLLIDQGVKLLVRRNVGVGTVRPGPSFPPRILGARIWLVRISGPVTFPALWTVWLLAGVALVLTTVLKPASAVFAGLLLGGSLSHLLESWAQGTVMDHIRLPFWPAFDLADVAITAGAIGIIGTLVT